jgi:hypothetical protein
VLDQLTESPARTLVSLGAGAWKVVAGGAALAGEALAALPRLADSSEALVSLLAEGVPALRQIAGLTETVSELAAARDVLSQLAESLASVRPVGVAIQDLREAVEVLNNTVTPLQGTAERLGRLVDRLPPYRRRGELGP